MQSGQGLLIRRIEIIFTTSRDAPLRVRRFLNELTFMFPNSIKVNRGRQDLKNIFSKSLYVQAKYLVIVDSIKGNPGRLRVYDLLTKSLKYYFIIYGVTLLTELKLSRTTVKRGCIGRIDNEDIRNMLIDFGYINVENCDVYAMGETLYKDGVKLLELKFIKDNKILGPIIRFKIDDRNKDIH